MGIIVIWHLSNLMQDINQRYQLLHAFTKSLATIWIVMTPVCGVGFLLTLGIRHYSLKRANRRSAAPQGKTTDPEAGPAVTNAEAAAPVAPGEAQPLETETATASMSSATQAGKRDGDVEKNTA